MDKETQASLDVDKETQASRVDMVYKFLFPSLIICQKYKIFWDNKSTCSCEIILIVRKIVKNDQIL